MHHVREMHVSSDMYEKLTLTSHSFLTDFTLDFSLKYKVQNLILVVFVAIILRVLESEDASDR